MKANGWTEGNRQATENVLLNVRSNHEKRKLSNRGGGVPSAVCRMSTLHLNFVDDKQIVLMFHVRSTYNVIIILHQTKLIRFVRRQQTNRKVYYHHFNFLPIAVFTFHNFPSSFAFWFSAFWWKNSFNFLRTQSFRYVFNIQIDKL